MSPACRPAASSVGGSSRWTRTSSGPPCASCHGADLRGVGLVPPIAGRSPTYLLRQLVAFRTGARNTPEGAPMKPVADQLVLKDMIAVAAYAGSVQP